MRMSRWSAHAFDVFTRLGIQDICKRPARPYGLQHESFLTRLSSDSHVEDWYLCASIGIDPLLYCALQESLHLHVEPGMGPQITQALGKEQVLNITIWSFWLQDEDCSLALALERQLPSAYRWRAAARRDCGWIAGALEDMRMAARMAPIPDKKEAALAVRTIALSM
jgi:hypothetical protein